MHWSVVVISTLEEDDAKGSYREREHLAGRCTSVVNRLKATLGALALGRDRR